MVQALPTASRAGSSYSPADGGLSTSSRWRGPVVARYSISGPAIEAFAGGVVSDKSAGGRCRGT